MPELPTSVDALIAQARRNGALHALTDLLEEIVHERDEFPPGYDLTSTIIKVIQAHAAKLV